MKITISLSEIIRECNDWDTFCDDMGYSVYAVKEGGGHIEVTLTKEEAQKYGLV